MVALRKKFVWYGNEGTDPGMELGDVFSANVRQGTEARSNVADLRLANPNATHVNPTGDFKFQENDIIKIYLKNATDSSDINTAVDTDLLMVANVLEWQGIENEKSAQWVLKCADKTYLMLNKVWAKAYLATETINTAPKIIQNIVRHSSEDPLGVYSSGGITYGIDARLVSEGGFIQDTRPGGSGFPAINIAKTFKPIYEWIVDLSKVESVNSEAELDGTGGGLKIKRSMIFFVDENNKLHWETVNTNVEEKVEMGKKEGDSYSGGGTVTATGIEANITRATFDVVNMVIFNAGKDINGLGILDYSFDDHSVVQTLKMTYRPFLSTALTLIKRDYAQLGPLDRKVANSNPNNPSFPKDTEYPYTPIWSSTAVNDDSEYNTSLRTAARADGKRRAAAVLAKLGNPRFKGTITVTGKKIIPGDLLEFTSSKLGITAQKLRIIDVMHNVDSSQWTTSLTVQEDEDEREL